MRARRGAFMVPILVGLAVSGCNGSIARSHIDANVPDAADFHRLMRRDLEAYFRERRVPLLELRYELLRDAPTQTGIAYPKYYAWVTLRDSAGRGDEGAVRLAAVEGTRFEVTHFLSKREILANPAGVESVFPRALCDGVRGRAGAGPTNR